MSSVALNFWLADRSAALDEIETAHRAVGGSGPGRRFATQQINHAYAVLLASQFQGFCRDLHTECVALMVRTVTNPDVQSVLQLEFQFSRSLDRGNANSELPVVRTRPNQPGTDDRRGEAVDSFAADGVCAAS